MTLVAFAGCHFTEIVWSKKLSSPDGKWLASVRTDNTDTIGNVEYTIVSVKEKGFWHRAKEVVVFDGIDDEQNLRLAWLSATQLEITVPDDVRIVKQNIGEAGVSIVVNHLRK